MPLTGKQCRCGLYVWVRSRRAYWWGPIGRGLWREKVPIGHFCNNCGDLLKAHGHTEPHPARLRQEKEAETDG